MTGNVSITEFEAAVVTRVLLDRMIDPRVRFARRKTFSYDEALRQSVYAANDILAELGINRDLWVRVRGKRAYMFHEPTRRIVAEVGIVTDDAGDGWRKRLRIELFGRGGRPIRARTLADLASSAAGPPRRRAHDHYKPKEVPQHG